MIGKICGTGSCLPSKSLDNNDLSMMVETSDEWIRERTGVIKRHIIEDETTVSMASKAAQKAVEQSRIKPEEIDLIIVSTISSDVIMPCAACEVQKYIGAVHAACFDLNAACTGFVFAYNTAQAYLAAGMYKTALIIGAESLSNLVNWADRGTCILFGDGAGAAVLRAEEAGAFAAVTHSMGEWGEALTCTSRHNKTFEESYKNKNLEGAIYEDTYMKMNGGDVFKFAVKKVPESIQELLKKTNLTSGDIDYYILHQANRRIVEAVAKRMKEPIEKFPMNLSEYGNTSSASIPILLDELNRKGVLKEGQNIVLAGFGAGLSWGASLLKW